MRERASVTNATAAKLIQFIPRTNFIDSSGTPRFVGSANAPVNVDSWTIDVSHNLTERDRLHGYFAFQTRSFTEPSRDGNTIRGFGSANHSTRPFFTLSETHTFAPNLVNEARLGFNRFTATPTRRRNSTRLITASLTALASPSAFHK